MAPRVRLGELLVEAQIITRDELEQVLEVQQRDTRRLGTLLIESGLVTETQVTQVLSQQLSVPWVSLYHVDFFRHLIDLVPQELAERYCLVPLFVRRVRGVGEMLYVAMDDPTHEEAKQSVAAETGLPVRAMIAPPTDIKAAIRAYYGAGAKEPSLGDAQLAADPQGGRVNPHQSPPLEFKRLGAEGDALRLGTDADHPGPVAMPTGNRAAIKASSSRADSYPQPGAPVPTAAVASKGSAPSEGLLGDPAVQESNVSRVAAREPVPPSKGNRSSRMLTVTLLDGTQVKLPQHSHQDEPGPETLSTPEGELTAKDLVAALRALSHGADATEILGDHVRWEAMFAALLSLLLKKHLIADREFLEEYKRI